MTYLPSSADENAKQQAIKLVETAANFLNAGQPQPALDNIIQAKSMRVVLRDLDYVRAVCFVQMQRIGEAKEALKEELRYHPDNTPAKDLLTQIDVALGSAAQNDFGDHEFGTVLSAVRTYTMLSEERLYSLFSNAKDICQRNLPGNFVECGVAAGGSSALLAYVIKRYSKQPRKLFCFDSFSGMPEATEKDLHQGVAADGTGWGAGTCAAPVESLLAICEKLGVKDIVSPVKGFFEDTVPASKDSLGAIALFHMDGDWYSSTKVLLDHLYERVIPTGFIQIDDFGYWDGCREAVLEFERKHSLNLDKHRIDDTGVWLKKP